MCIKTIDCSLRNRQMPRRSTASQQLRERNPRAWRTSRRITRTGPRLWGSSATPIATKSTRFHGPLPRSKHKGPLFWLIGNQFWFFRLTSSQERLKSSSLQNLNAQRKVKQTKSVSALEFDLRVGVSSTRKLFRFQDREPSFKTFRKALRTRSSTDTTCRFACRRRRWRSICLHRGLQNPRSSSAQSPRHCRVPTGEECLTTNTTSLITKDKTRSRIRIRRRAVSSPTLYRPWLRREDSARVCRRGESIDFEFNCFQLTPPLLRQPWKSSSRSLWKRCQPAQRGLPPRNHRRGHSVAKIGAPANVGKEQHQDGHPRREAHDAHSQPQRFVERTVEAKVINSAYWKYSKMNWSRFFMSNQVYKRRLRDQLQQWRAEGKDFVWLCWPSFSLRS